jgi:hypothetical protein
MLTRGTMLRCLSELADGPRASGAEGGLTLFGGAAMCHVHDARHPAGDIDALYPPKDLITPLILRIALKHDLPPYWLNDSGSVFIKGEPPRDGLVPLEGLKVYSVTPQCLPAMKVMAGRDPHDMPDAAPLIGELNFTTEKEVTDLTLPFYDGPEVDGRIRAGSQSILAFMNDHEKCDP